MSEQTPLIIKQSRTRSIGDDFQFSKAQVRKTNSSEINTIRENAWSEYRKTALPTTKEEAWRRTDLRPMQVEKFQLLTDHTQAETTEIPPSLLRPVADGDHGGQVIIKGVESKVYLENSLAQKGVVFTDLITAEQEYPQLLEKIFGKVVLPGDGKFAAMATALAQNGIFLYVPKGVQVEAPLHSLIWGADVDIANISHILIYVDNDASVTYVHEVASETLMSGQSFQASNIEMYVGANANLRFVELQSWGRHVWNFTHERVHVDRDGKVDWIFGAIGGHLTKNFAELDLIAKGASGKMSGFYFTDRNQHLDYDSQQNHMAPNTTSDLLFKGALVEQSRSVWQGMIYVAPGADKTDGYQANRNLLLSRDARADSIPGLEILADDVRCTHGATVGKIDAEQIFYLMSRGIARLDAERLIVEGFFDPIMQRIPFEGVRKRFQDAITEKMGSYTG